jgi:two-component system OmpR family response regulator
VEDDPDIREVIAEVLRDGGYTVVEAADGTAAFGKLAQVERPCLILLDLALPGMDGFEFLRRLKDHPHASEFPVLIMTAHDTATATAEHSPGVLGTLRKPFDVETLLAWVNEHC